MIKKFTLLLLAMVAVVNMAKADVEWTIWEGTATASNVTMNPVDFTNVEAGDIMYVYASSALAHRGLAAQLTSGWTWTDESSLMKPVDIDGKNDYYYVINAAFVTLLASSDTKSFIVTNYGSGTITKVTIKKKNSMIKHELSSAVVSFGCWGASYTVNTMPTVKDGDYLYMPASKATPPVTDKYDWMWNGTRYSDQATFNSTTKELNFSGANGYWGVTVNDTRLNKYSAGNTVTVEFASAITSAVTLKATYSTTKIDAADLTVSQSATSGATSVSLTIPTTSTYIGAIYLESSAVQTVTLNSANATYSNDDPYYQTQFSYGDGWTSLYSVNSFTHDNWKTVASSSDATTLSSNSLHVGGSFYNATGLYLYHPVTSFSIGSIGLATFCADVAVNIPDGINAYWASVSGDYNNVILTKITDGKIPANTGVIIEGAEGSVVEFTTTETATTYPSNILVGVTDDTAMTEGDFVLYNDGGTAEFRKVTASTLKANKAYIPKAKVTVALSRGLGIKFGDGTTSINKVVTEQKTDSEGIFTLSGQRVNQPSKGIYIVNGKKMIFK